MKSREEFPPYLGKDSLILILCTVISGSWSGRGGGKGDFSEETGLSRRKET